MNAFSLLAPLVAAVLLDATLADEPGPPPQPRKARARRAKASTGPSKTKDESEGALPGDEPATSPATGAAGSTSREQLRRLARLTLLTEQRRDERARLAGSLEPLQRAGLMTVSAEAAWVPRLDDLLGQANRALAALGEDEDAEEVDDRLASLDALLGGFEWDVVAGIVPQLETKLKTQQEIVRGFSDKVDAWKKRLEPLRAEIEEGRSANAPLRIAEGALLRLEDLVRQAERALQDQRFQDMADPVARLDADPDPPEALAEQVHKRARSARRFVRQADVLLLQSSIENRHAYTVLLRTPSEPGSHGINIQDSSTLVDEDRRYVRAVIDRVTAAVDAGLVRAFRGRAAPEVAPAQPGPPAAPVAVIVAPPVEPAPAAGTEAVSAPVPAVDGLREVFRPAAQVGPQAEQEDLNTLIRSVGDVMFRLFMPDHMRQYLSTTPCSLTVTTNDLELPWELMHDDGWEQDEEEEAEEGFLCLQRPVARMPMGRAFPRMEGHAIAPHSKLRFLLIHADPKGTLPAARREIDQIQKALQERWNQPGKEQIEIDVVEKEQATGERLNQALLSGSYDVIHFAGHAYFDEHDPDMSGLLLANEEVFLSQKIQRFVEGRPLVFLNACQSGRTANEDNPQSVGQYFWKPAEGLASAFLYGGALGCVGSLWPIYDTPAADFAVNFYNEVLEGQMIGEAMRRARRANRRQHPDSITWASFVLYGDPTFRLTR